jgi:hypothetical protein
MKKSLILAVLLVFLFPLFANASWWNPLDWFSFLFGPKTYEVVVVPPVALKQPVVEPITQVVSTTTVMSTSSIKVGTKAVNKVEPKKVIKQPVVVPPVAAVVEIIKPTTIQAGDYLEEYREVLTRYFKLRDSVKNAKDRVIASDKGNLLYTDRADYLQKLEIEVNSNIAEVSKFDNVTPKPADVINKHLKKSESLMVAFDASTEQFRKDDLRFRTMQYIEDAKYDLASMGVHLQAADMLYQYDKTFGTSYAPQFRITKTDQETAEFAQMFLSDLRNR